MNFKFEVNRVIAYVLKALAPEIISIYKHYSM